MLLVLTLSLVVMALGAPVLFVWALGRAVQTIGQAQERAVGALEQAASTAARTILTPTPVIGGKEAAMVPLPAAFDGVSWAQDDWVLPDGDDPTDATLPNPEYLRPVGMTVTSAGDSPFGIPGLGKDPERYAGRA